MHFFFVLSARGGNRKNVGGERPVLAVKCMPVHL